MSFEFIENGSVTTPQGFRAAGVTAGFKRSGAPDFAMVVSDAPADFAGVFTSCTFAAAPVRLCQKRVLENDALRAVIINSGNANACTGEQGMASAKQVLADVSKLDENADLAKLILAMYEKILAGATVADLRRAADSVKAASLKDII